MQEHKPNLLIISKCFSLDYPNYRILEYFAKNGKSNRMQVGNYNFKYYPNLENKQVGRRIESLEQLGYLEQIEIRKIGNLKNKVEKFYDLTFKGFLASLFFCSLENNQFFKKYLEFSDTVDDWQAKNIDDVFYGKANKISSIITKIVSLQIEHFCYHNSIRGITFDTMKNFPSWFDVYDNSHGISNNDLINLDKIKAKVLTLFDELNESNDINSKYQPDIFLWSTHWIHVISFISQGISKNKILINLRKNFPSEFVTFIRKEEEKELEESIKRSIKVDSGASDIFYGRKLRSK
ncbi:MAG TPA: hypothetical protein OQH55_05375 [Nitrosopumilus sp.]|nr:hypothetical protein [Nitrosopumilus sp.]